MRKLVAAILFIGLGLPVLAADDAEKVPSISVNGTGEVKATPDQGTVRLGVVQEATNAQEAQQRVNSIAQAILAGVRQLGIDPKQVQTSQLNLYPVYSETQPNEPMRGERPRILGYRASNVVSVIVNTIEKVGPVIDAGLKAGANQLEGVMFGLQDDTAARHEALTKAAHEAQDKAKTIADALGLNLTGILEVAESGVSVVPMMAKAEMMMARADVSTPVAPGEVSVNASLTIRYRIASR